MDHYNELDGLDDFMATLSSPGENNPRSIFPDCVALHAWYEDVAGENKKSLHVDLHFGTQALAATKADETFFFKMRVKNASLEFIKLEAMEVGNRNVFGIQSVEPVQIRRNISKSAVSKQYIKAEVAAKINSASSIFDAIGLLLAAGLETEKIQEILETAEVDHVISSVEMVRNHRREPRWKIQPLPISSGHHFLSGRYWKPDSQALCNLRISDNQQPLGPTVLLGVFCDAHYIDVEIDETKLPTWFAQTMEKFSFQTKKAAAQAYIQEAIKRHYLIDTDLSDPTNRVLLATAVAVEGDF